MEPLADAVSDEVSESFAQSIVVGALATLAMVRLGIALGAPRFALGISAVLALIVVVVVALTRERSDLSTR